MTQDHNDKDGLERARERDAALDNHNAELSETKAGYLYLSGAVSDDSRPDIRAKKTRKADADLAQLSALQQFLADSEYAEAYNDASDNITAFKERMAERLEELDNQIEALDEKLEGLGPGSPEYKRFMREREQLQRKQQDLLDYYNDTVRPIEDRMNDPDNPPTREELDEFNDKVRQKMETTFGSEHSEQMTREPTSAQTVATKLPDLGA